MAKGSGDELEWRLRTEEASLGMAALEGIPPHPDVLGGLQPLRDEIAR